MLECRRRCLQLTYRVHIDDTRLRDSSGIFFLMNCKLKINSIHFGITDLSVCCCSQQNPIDFGDKPAEIQPIYSRSQTHGITINITTSQPWQLQKPADKIHIKQTARQYSYSIFKANITNCLQICIPNYGRLHHSIRIAICRSLSV